MLGRDGNVRRGAARGEMSMQGRGSVCVCVCADGVVLQRDYRLML